LAFTTSWIWFGCQFWHQVVPVSSRSQLWEKLEYLYNIKIIKKILCARNLVIHKPLQIQQEFGYMKRWLFLPSHKVTRLSPKAKPFTKASDYIKVHNASYTFLN
jgi:hypothetical protein